MSEIPMDMPYQPQPRPELDVEIVVTCGAGAGSSHQKRVFEFQKHRPGGWSLNNARDTANADDMDRPLRSKGGRFQTGSRPGGREGWRLWCAKCGRDEQFQAAKLEPVLNRLAESGVQEIALASLAAVYGQVVGSSRHR